MAGDLLLYIYMFEIKQQTEDKVKKIKLSQITNVTTPLTPP